MIRYAAIAMLSACSFGLQGVDPRWDGTSEPPSCSDSTILLDRVVGAALLVAGIGAITSNQATEPSLWVGAPTIGLGVVYELAASYGNRTYTACQTARMRWAYSNAIKARAPGKPAPAAAPAVVSQAVATSGERPGDAARPWASGVPDSEQKVALELYEAGNRDYVHQRYPQALVSYREALEHWDHPAIRFNLAVCLIDLGRPVEARNHLERAMAYGAAALGGESFAQGERYRRQLDARLVRLTLDCPEPGEEVLIDGELVFTGPGMVDRFLLPGEHHIVATKPGFLPATRKVVLVAGQPASYEIRPFVDPRPATR